MGIPGLQRLDHIGFTVPDLDEAHRFLVDVLGCEYLYSLGPFASDRRRLDARAPQRAPAGGGHREPVLPLRRPGGLRGLRLRRPRPASTSPPRNSDVGGHHVALYVDDLDAAVAYLRDQGVEVLGEPTASKGPAEGNRWVYFLSPWGMQFELVSYPGGKAFDRAAGGDAS